MSQAMSAHEQFRSISATTALENPSIEIGPRAMRHLRGQAVSLGPDHLVQLGSEIWTLNASSLVTR